MLEFKHFIGCFVFSDNFLAIRKPKFQQDITYADYFIEFDLCTFYDKLLLEMHIITQSEGPVSARQVRAAAISSLI